MKLYYVRAKSHCHWRCKPYDCQCERDDLEPNFGYTLVVWGNNVQEALLAYRKHHFDTMDNCPHWPDWIEEIKLSPPDQPGAASPFLRENRYNYDFHIDESLTKEEHALYLECNSAIALREM